MPSLYDDLDNMAEEIRQKRIEAKKVEEVKKDAKEELKKEEKEHKEAKERGMI